MEQFQLFLGDARVDSIEIDGVGFKVLDKHEDDRGHLMELLRCDDPQYTKFGQAYTSLSKPGVIRRWHYHARNHEYFSCILGNVLLALADLRTEEGKSRGVRGFMLGEDSPLLVGVPPGVAHGIAVLGTSPAILVDFDSEPYNPAAPDMVPVEPPIEVPQSLEEIRDEFVSNRRSWLYRVGFRKVDA